MTAICSRTLLALAGAVFLGTSQPLMAQAQDPSFGPTVRWQDDDGAALWVGTDVAIGDAGATVIAAKESNRQRISVYSAVVGDSLFDHLQPDSLQIRVDAAAQSTTLAAMVLHYKRPGSTADLEPELWVWENATDPEPAWKYTFPGADSWFYTGMDVHVSADGQTIVAWNTYTTDRRVLIHVFDLDGTVRGSFETTRRYNSAAGEHVVVSRDMQRLLIDVGGHPQLIDLQTGDLLKEWQHHSLWSGHTLSGDGRTVAIGDDEQVRIHREDAEGRFPRIGTYTLPSDQNAGALALDNDGSHLAVLANASSPRDRLDLVVYQVDTGQDLALHTFHAPNNYLNLKATGLQMTEDAAMIVGSTYGDDFGFIPDAFAYELGKGLTAEIYTEGSAFACDMDPSGQVFVVATKDKHANEIGTGGDIVCADTRLPGLVVHGHPRLGQTMTVEVRGNHEQAWVAAATALGSGLTPWGTSQLDVTSIQAQGLLSVRKGVGQRTIHLPTLAAMAGIAIHIQAGFLDEGRPAGPLTNRVSLRIQP